MFKLQPGDKVGITSLASFIRPGDIDLGLDYLQSLGLVPVLGSCTYAEYRYMAGTPQNRAKDLMDFFHDDSIKAIFTPRGGAGTSFILPYLDYEFIKIHPKPIFGLSDITIVQNAIYAQSGATSYTGFLLKYDFKDGGINPMVDESFRNLIGGKPVCYQGGETVIAGIAEAPLIGGNQTVLHYLAGTPYAPNLCNKILLLEDVGGKSYQVDLRLQQLRHMPGFDGLKGIIFGEFSNCTVFDPEDGTIDEIIDYFCADLKIPVLKHFPYGHIPARRILPIGLTVKLNACDCTVEF